MEDAYNYDAQTHIERLRKETMVALEQVKLLHQWLDRKRNSRQCGRITGESRTGKTKACDAYLKRRGQPDFSGKTPIIPVSYILPNHKCSLRELFRQILEFYNFDLPKGTVGDARSFVLKVLHRSQTEILVIDRANRLSKETFANVQDISDQLKIAVILVGDSKLLDMALKEDKQLYNRFRSNHRVSTIQTNELQKIVGSWERLIIDLPVPSHLTDEPMLTIIRPAIVAPHGGYSIGLIDSVLREAAIRSLEKGMMHIGKNVLAEVAAEYS